METHQPARTLPQLGRRERHYWASYAGSLHQAHWGLAMNQFEFETCAQIWERQWKNHVWNMQGMKWQGSDKIQGICWAAQSANANMVIAEALKL